MLLTLSALASMGLTLAAVAIILDIFNPSEETK
jgi:hypothetical protein